MWRESFPWRGTLSLYLWTQLATPSTRRVTEAVDGRWLAGRQLG